MLMKEIKPVVTENCELYYLEKHIFSNFVKNSDYQSSDAGFNIVTYQFSKVQKFYIPIECSIAKLELQAAVIPETHWVSVEAHQMSPIIR